MIEMNNEMKNEMLEDAALEEVSGGANLGNYHFTGRVEPENCVIGQNYYAVYGSVWYYGRLEGITPGDAMQTYKIHTVMQNGARSEGSLLMNAAQVKLYTQMSADC